MSLRRIIAISLGIAGSGMMVGSAHADATFSDSTFAGYELGFAASQGTATFDASQCADCGDPSGNALHLVISDSDGSNFGAAVMNPLFTYDPVTQGAIASISATVNKNLTVSAPPLFSYGNTFRLVVEQDGNFYTAVVFGTSVGAPAGGDPNANVTTSSGYAPFTLSDLAATDFNEFDTSTGLVGTAHPDFAGDTLDFGFGQVLSANPISDGHAITVTSDFDNLMIDVKSVPVAAAVPEPATWAMFLAGMGLVGWAMRRRRQQQVAIGFA